MTSYFVRLSIVLLTSMSASQTWAAREVNNGAGLSEQNLIYAFANLAGLLKPCLQSDACSLSLAAKESLAQVVDTIRSARIELRFENRASLGDRLYVVESERWRINGDLLWTDRALSIPYSLPDAVSLLLTIGDAEKHLSATTLEHVFSFLSQDTVERMIVQGADRALHVLFIQERSRIILFANTGDALEITSLIANELHSQNLLVLDPIYLGSEASGKDLRIHLKLRIKRERVGVPVEFFATLLLTQTTDHESTLKVDELIPAFSPTEVMP